MSKNTCQVVLGHSVDFSILIVELIYYFAALCSVFNWVCRWIRFGLLLLRCIELEYLKGLFLLFLITEFFNTWLGWFVWSALLQYSRMKARVVGQCLAKVFFNIRSRSKICLNRSFLQCIFEKCEWQGV